jgi:hypothetical protein
MANNPNLKEAQSKGGKVTGPRKNGYFREQLEKYIFGDEEVFKVWVSDNYTDAVKELGKLQPKNLTLGGDADNPLKHVVAFELIDGNDKDTEKT